ncbi:hypothetical protein, partial [Escherichia coli]|uniref:hypothetical protein n=1 Tax=Escherichia coli TaxID=562 RepID=UPI001D0AF1D8
KKIAKRQLRGRMMFLHRIHNNLTALRKNADPSKKHLHIIIEHDLDLVYAEIKSIAKLVEILT